MAYKIYILYQKNSERKTHRNKSDQAENNQLLGEHFLQPIGFEIAALKLILSLLKS
jgi:hypothetical protein